MKNILCACFCLISFQFIQAQNQNDITFDYFKPNSKLNRIQDVAPSGDQINIYLDMYKDYWKSDIEYVVDKMNEGIALFQDSLYDATKIHTLEIAITKDKEHTFYRYSSRSTESTDVTIVDGTPKYIKHIPDTILVYEHFEHTSMGDTFHYVVMYELLSKDLSRAQEKRTVQSVADVHQYKQEKRNKYMGFKQVISRLGVGAGFGATINRDLPVGMHMEAGIFYQTGRKVNNYVPFVGYNYRANIGFNDGVYQGTQFHMIEFGTLKSNFYPYHLMYNKYSIAVGIMQLGVNEEFNRIYQDQPIYFALGLSFPIAYNVGMSLDVGGDLFKRNGTNYASFSFKAYLGITD